MRMTLATVLTVALATTQSAAQTVHIRSAAGSAGAVAAIAPPPPVVVAPGYYRGTYGNPGYTSGMAFYSNLPIVVLPDGRVYADFGRGYERIARGCNAQPSYSVPVQVGQQNVTQPTVYQPSVGVSQPLPYTPPAPNQQTASQQMLNQSNPQALAIQSNLVNQQSCWSGNGRGQVSIARQW